MKQIPMVKYIQITMKKKPSVDLNESHREVEPIVNFKKGAVTYVKMNETYNSGACECTVLKAYSTVSSSFALIHLEKNIHSYYLTI